jgi:hypothetical protein
MSRESDFYINTVPNVVNERLVRNAYLAVLAAQHDARRWPGFELDAVPDLRRLNMLSGLILATYAPGVTASQVAHQGGSHVEIAGEGWVISTVTRALMPTKVEPHLYRATLAESAQPPLPGVIEEPKAGSGFIYGLTVFGGSYAARLPTFCRMAFPTVKGELAPGTIDLLALCPDVVAAFGDNEYRERETAQFIALRETLRRAG